MLFEYLLFCVTKCSKFWNERMTLNVWAVDFKFLVLLKTCCHPLRWRSNYNILGRIFLFTLFPTINLYLNNGFNTFNWSMNQSEEVFLSHDLSSRIATLLWFVSFATNLLIALALKHTFVKIVKFWLKKAFISMGT